MKSISITYLTILCLLFSLSVYGQNEALNLTNDQVLRVYLEGEVEDFNFTRRNLKFVDFVNDLQNYNLSAELDVSVRISKGLSVFCEIGAESVHDQLYLPKDEVSLEELLLNSRKLPSTDEFGGDIGIRIYFGSLYNNIVNQRL